MQSIFTDKDGKVTDKSPKFLVDVEDKNLALRHLFVRSKKLRKQIDVQGLMVTARQLIRFESTIDCCDFRFFVETILIVPADREDLDTTGMTRYFGGDFFSARHILVSRLEYLLRHVLK